MDSILTGDEHIIFDGVATGHLLSDFWAWSSSDLLNNTLRGGYAEFLVSAALELDLTKPRTDWTAYDVEYPTKDGHIRIEVKSSAYLQAWDNKKPSRIQFTIRPTRAWSVSDGYSTKVVHQSDVYVFCVYTVKDRTKANPLLLEDWDFYVLPTSVLSAKCEQQQSISLAALLALEPRKTDYYGLEAAILGAFNFPEITPPPRILTNFNHNFLCNFANSMRLVFSLGASLFSVRSYRTFW